MRPPKTLPKFADRLLRWLLKVDLVEEISGDLYEYYTDLSGLPKWKRNVYFWIHFFSFLRPFALRRFSGDHRLTHYGMLQNHFKIAYRNVLKNTGFFAINTGGLTLGIATCLLILLYVVDELSYDRYHVQVDQIVRVVLKGEVQGESIREAVVPAPVVAAFNREIPEVLQGTRLKATSAPLIVSGQAKFRDSQFAFADPNFFSIFSIQFIKGDKNTALADPTSVVLTEKEAIKYFANEDPIGQVLDFKEWGQKFTVTGVIEEIPDNSHFHFDILGSMLGREESKSLTWLEGGYSSYLLLDPATNYKEVEAKLPAIVSKYMGPQLKEAMGVSMQEFEESGNSIGLYLQPLNEVHLYSDFAASSELEPGGNVVSLYIFGAIGLFVLLVACVNFINLSTAASSKRSKEVGIKKVLGSGRGLLLQQFLTESFLSTATAMTIAPLLVWLSIPLFNEISGKLFNISDFFAVEWLLFYVAFGFILTVLAGLYPAFVLSSFQPLAALKNRFSAPGGRGIRSGLVVFQFTISIVMIISTFVVDQQMVFIQDKDIGYDKNQMIVISDSWLLGDQQKLYKDQLLNHTSVVDVSLSQYLPAGPTYTSMTGIHLSLAPGDFRRTPVYYVDEHYLATLGIDLIAGRNFDAAYGDESSHIIVNETFTKLFGLGDDAVGKSVKSSIDNEGGKVDLLIVGVIKDFHFKPLHLVIEPLILLPGSTSGLIVKANSQDMDQVLVDMEILWNDLDADEPFRYSLLDESYKKAYRKEAGVGTLLRVFAILTIIVACLGLLGLMTFTIEQRVKEIGIRKVLGSSAGEIVVMLCFSFLKLVGIAMLIAFPLGYIASNRWLSDFAYRIDIPFWVFFAAGFFAVFIAFLTIGFRTYQAARLNPIVSLQDE
jgi:putative ABC transport system permease protein